MTTDSGATEYEYDAADRLQRAGETNFAYDAAWRMTARWQGEEVTSYRSDAQGNPALLTDQQGEVAEEYRYDAFGGLYTGLTAPYNTVGLTGKTYDPKAGLLDFATRWYDPALGRFMTPDVYRGTLQSPLTQHLYAAK